MSQLIRERKVWSCVMIFILLDTINTHHEKKAENPCKLCNKSNSSCGDSLCCCIGEWACCGYANLKYIPELPESVRSIDFSHNNVNNLTRQTFSNIAHLKIKSLMLRYTGIEHISSDSFKELPYLQELDLKGNKNINQEELSTSFSSIQRRLDLSIILDGCGLDRLSDNFLFGLLDSKVVKISLRVNQMKQYNEITFMNLTTLKFLDLSDNWIENISVPVSGKRVGHKTIQNLTLSNNVFLRFPPWFCDIDSNSLYPSLKKLDLSGNFIIFPVRHAWSCLKNLTEMSLAKNVLQIIENDVFSDLVSLEMLDVSHMMRSIKNISVRAFNISSLRTLHFENNQMKFEKDSGTQYEKLFMYMPVLRVIHLEANEIWLDNSTIVRMLEPLTQLEHLHLGDTNLRTIPTGLLGKFKKLSLLNLSKNKLSSIEPRAFENVTMLKKLYLYENRIEEINSTSFPKSVKLSLEVVNLADNPFSCTPCKNMWFRGWLKTPRIKFLGWPNNYTCYNPKSMKGKSLRDYHPEPKDCKAMNPMLAVYISIGVFLLITVTFGSAIYRGRWYLRYWIFRFHWRCKRMGNNDPERQGLLEEEIMYDAYVIYHDADRCFVRNTLLPFMEEQHGYRLFIRHREPEQGAKVDIMVESIYRSNFVIAVISRKFLKDQWCEFQLAVTIDRQVDLKRNYLLLITLEDVDKSLLSKSWCVLLTRTPTAEWCDKKNGIKRKLYEHQITTTIPHINSCRTVN